ncbi:hypothetical protein DSECCO2_215570 [anaerobic digester metagenome]
MKTCLIIRQEKNKRKLQVEEPETSLTSEKIYLLKAKRKMLPVISGIRKQKSIQAFPVFSDVYI